MKPSAAIGVSALGVVVVLGCAGPSNGLRGPAGSLSSPSVSPDRSSTPVTVAPQPPPGEGVAGVELRQASVGRGGGGDVDVRPLGRRLVSTGERPLWEYRVVTLTELLRGSRRQYRNIEENLNLLGADGWDLAYGTADFFVFRRPAD